MWNVECGMWNVECGMWKSSFYAFDSFNYSNPFNDFGFLQLNDSSQLDIGGPDGTRTRDLRRDRPAF